MADTKNIFVDPRRRNLAIFAGVALVCALLAFLGLHKQASTVAPKYAQTEFLPGFAAHVRQAARIHIVSKKNGAFDVAFKPSKGWVLPQKNDYPASFAMVNRTITVLERMQTVEPKTARADWLHYIGLDDPAKGGLGIEITVSDEHGHALARLIVGKSTDIGDSGGAIGLFVRRPGEAQSWLVRAESEFQAIPDEWIDKSVLDDLDPAAIQSTVMTAADGKSYEVLRDSKKDMHFKLAQMPVGREIAAEEAPDGVGAALTGFAFTDVQPAKEIDFSTPVRVTTRTFDGLSITAEVAHTGIEYWAKLSAASLSNKAETAKVARIINQRSNGWAYKLADYKGAQLTAPLESLLKPKDGGAQLPPRPTP